MESVSKPQILSPQSHLLKSVLSMLGYFAAYYFFIDQDLVNAVAVVIIILIHEAGHYFAMKYYNYQDVKMLFVPFLGAFVSGDREKISQKEKVIVLLSGPLPGIIIGLLLLIFNLFFGYNSQLVNLANLFVFINAFNLLPVTPLDGGRLAEVLFVGGKEILQAVFIISSSILLILISWKLESYFLLVLVVLLFLRLRLIFKTKKIRQVLKERSINYHKSYSELSDEEYFSIKEVVLEYTPELKKQSNTDSVISIVKDILLDAPAQRLTGMSKLLIILLWIFFLIAAPLLLLRMFV